MRLDNVGWRFASRLHMAVGFTERSAGRNVNDIAPSAAFPSTQSACTWNGSFS